MNIAKNNARYRQLRTGLTQWVELTEAQWNKLAAIFQLRSIQKQEYLLFPGDNIHELYFICEGLLRFYYVSEDGVESNKAFKAENKFAGPLSVADLDRPSIYGVQALEPTTLLIAQYADFVALFEQDPTFDRLGRRLAEWLLTRKELRVRNLLQKQARERYLDFANEHPNLTQRIPKYHIASYLGITEVSLSRLRRSLEQPEFA